MKKYKLKEEAKKYLHFNETALNQVLTLREWERDKLISLEALEEVEERIELYSRPRREGMLDNGHTKIIVGLQKVSGEIFTDQEKQLCEKALNGELFTKDDMEAFVNYSRRVDNINSPTNMLIKDFLRMNNDNY